MKSLGWLKWALWSLVPAADLTEIEQTTLPGGSSTPYQHLTNQDVFYLVHISHN